MIETNRKLHSEKIIPILRLPCLPNPLPLFPPRWCRTLERWKEGVGMRGGSPKRGRRMPWLHAEESPGSTEQDAG